MSRNELSVQFQAETRDSGCQFDLRLRALLPNAAERPMPTGSNRLANLATIERVVFTFFHELAEWSGSTRFECVAGSRRKLLLVQRGATASKGIMQSELRKNLSMPI